MRTAAALAATLLIVAGCGSGEGPATFSFERVHRLLYNSQDDPRLIAGLVPLINLRSPNPYGDLADYAFYVIRIGDDPDLRYQVGELSVFTTDPQAEAASRAIAQGGPCDAHPNKKPFLEPVTRCEHYRVGNALLILALDGVPKPATLRQRDALKEILGTLGAPTTS